MTQLDTVQETMEAAARAQAEGRGDDLARLLAHAISLHEKTGEPISLAAFFTLARILYASGRHVEAEPILRKGLAKKPKDFDLNNLMGVVLKNLGRLKESLTFLAAAQKASPKNASPLVNAGNVHLLLGDPRKARDMFSRAAKLMPKDGETRRLLGVACRRAGDFTRARRELEAACALAPDSPACRQDLAWFLEETGHGDKAEAVAAAALERFGPTPAIVRLRAVLLRRHGRHKEAAQWLQELIRSGSQVPMVFLELARTLKNFSPAKANGAFAQAMRLAPEDPEIVTEFADNLQRTRGPEEGRNIQQAYLLARKRLAMAGDMRSSAKSLRDIFIRCADYEAAGGLGGFGSGEGL